LDSSYSSTLPDVRITETGFVVNRAKPPVAHLYRQKRGRGIRQRKIMLAQQVYQGENSTGVFAPKDKTVN
jgi:hypothetical protein